MALIKMSSLGITNISGKAGGSVYAHNRGGSYVRNFAVPSNPQTEAQQNARARFGVLSSLWRQLSLENQEAWRQAAQNFPVKNPFGDERILSGIALHQQLNRNLGLVQAPSISNPPVPTGAGSFMSPNVTASVETTTGVATISVEAANAGMEPTDTRVLVYATPSLSAGINSAENQMRLIDNTSAININGGYDITEAYEAVFGTPQVDAVVIVKVQGVSTVSGERGAPSSARTLVVGTTTP